MSTNKILIVDDNSLLRKLGFMYLQRPGYEIETADSGAEALEMVDSYEPNIILMDLVMPEMWGDEVCSILKESPDTEKIPIMMVSADSHEGAREKCEAAGCNGFVQKPLTRSVMISWMEKLLNLRKRAHPRVATMIPCHINSTTLSNIPAMVRNLAVKGAFIETEDEISGDSISDGSQVKVSFQIPEKEDIRTESLIRWGATGDKGKVEGFGVEFLGITSKSEYKILNFVGKRIREFGKLA